MNSPPAPDDRGSATAELAITLPVITLILTAILLAALGGAKYLACAHDAGVIARQISVGITETAAIAALTEPAAITVDYPGGWVRVTCSRPLTSLLGGLDVTATATTPLQHG